MSMEHRQYASCTATQDPYLWEPHASCELPQLDRETVCWLLAGSHLLLVGDSTLQMLFYSLALATGARTSMAPDGLRRVAHVRCGGGRAGEVTITSVQNHLLLPRDNGTAMLRRLEKKGHRHVRRQIPREPWETVEAVNLTLFGGGLHDVSPEGDFLYGQSFYSTRLAAAVRAQGAARSAVVALAAPTPGCINHTSPLRLKEARALKSQMLLANRSQALAADVAGARYLAQWRVWAGRAAEMQSVAHAEGASFLDLRPFTSTRPDRALGHTKVANGGKGTGAPRTPIAARDRDCVHFCLPGPTDTAARVVLAWSASQLATRSSPGTRCRLSREQCALVSSVTN